MKKYSPIDWQAFSQKKDIEKIAHSLKSHNEFQLTAFIEVALVVLGAALSNIVTTSKAQFILWLSILIASLIVISIPAVFWIRRKIHLRKQGNNVLSERDAIDCFDNELCYFVMTADSYFNMYNERKEEILTRKIDTKEKIDDILEFYYIEASYYLNKSIMCLQPIYNMEDKVLTNNKDEVIAKRIISYRRFENVCNIIKRIYGQLMAEDIEVDDIIKSVNSNYYSIFNDILVLVNGALDNSNSQNK